MKPASLCASRFGGVPIALLCAALSGTLVSCSPPPPKPPPAPRVSVSAPFSATVTNWDEYPGHIEAVETVDVRPRVGGYLESIHFQDGAEVKAGDLLFVIDPKPYQAELDRTEADAALAQTRLELARDDLKRAESLRGTKAISEEEYDSRSKAVRQAEALVASARAAQATARLNLEYTRITAPLSGKIGRRLVTPGNLVQVQAGGGGATVLATIVSLDPVYCYFDVEEGAFLKYRGQGGIAELAQGAGSGLACELGLVNEQGFAHRGRLDFFDNQVNPKNGTLRLRAVFANPERVLVPGMFANVRILAGPPEQATLIPDVAVLSDLGYKYVYVLGAQNKVETRSVQTGRAYGGLRAITQGLAATDQVITNGLVMLRPGIEVQVHPETNTARAEAKSASTGALR